MAGFDDINDAWKKFGRNQDQANKMVREMSSAFDEATKNVEKLQKNADHQYKMYANIKKRLGENNDKVKDELKLWRSINGQLQMSKGAAVQLGNVYEQNYKRVKKITETQQTQQKDFARNMTEKMNLTQKLADKMPGSRLLGLDKIADKTGRNMQAGMLKGLRKGKGISGVMKGMSKSMGALFGGIGKMFLRMLGPIGIIIMAVQAIVALFKMAKEYDNLMSSAAKQLKISREQSKEMAEDLRSTEGFDSTFKNVLPYMVAIKKAFGSIAKSSEFFIKNAQQAEKTAFHLGLSAEQGEKLAIESFRLQKSTDDYLVELNNVTSELNEQTGAQVQMEEVMAGIQNISAGTRAILGDSTDTLAKAAHHAARLGISIDQMYQTTRQMLEIESSVSAEFEARVMSGKNINMDRARVLTLEGKITEAHKEIVHQMGTYDDFANRSLLTKESMAKAAGMEVGQLNEILLKEKLRGAMEGENRAQINTLLNERNKALMEANWEDKKHIEEKLAKLGIVNAKSAEELRMSKDRLSVDEKMNRVKEHFTEVLASNLGGLTSLMEGLADFGMAVMKYGFWGAISGDADVDIAADRVLSIEDKLAELEEMKAQQGGSFTEKQQKEYASLSQSLTDSMEDLRSEIKYGDWVGAGASELEAEAILDETRKGGDFQTYQKGIEEKSVEVRKAMDQSLQAASPVLASVSNFTQGAYDLFGLPSPADIAASYITEDINARNVANQKATEVNGSSNGSWFDKASDKETTNGSGDGLGEGIKETNNLLRKLLQKDSSVVIGDNQIHDLKKRSGYLDNVSSGYGQKT